MIGIVHSRPCHAEANATQTYQVAAGLEWMEMSAGERMDQVMAAMYLLNKKGIGLSFTPNHYFYFIY